MHLFAHAVCNVYPQRRCLPQTKDDGPWTMDHNIDVYVVLYQKIVSMPARPHTCARLADTQNALAACQLPAVARRLPLDRAQLPRQLLFALAPVVQPATLAEHRGVKMVLNFFPCGLPDQQARRTNLRQ
eukprot:349953-Chlamydomonas_euryale.AAC.2